MARELKVMLEDGKVVGWKCGDCNWKFGVKLPAEYRDVRLQVVEALFKIHRCENHAKPTEETTR